MHPNLPPPPPAGPLPRPRVTPPWRRRLEEAAAVLGLPAAPWPA